MRFSSIMPLYLTSSSFPLILKKHPHSMILPPLCFTVGMKLAQWCAVPGFIQTHCLAFKPKSSTLVSSIHRILFLMTWESFRCLLVKSKQDVSYCSLRSGFCLATLQLRPNWLYWRDGYPSDKFSHHHTGPLVFRHSDLHGFWLVSWLKTLSWSCRKCLSGSDHFCLTATIFRETVKAADIFQYLFPPDLCLNTILSVLFFCFVMNHHDEKL